MVVIFIGIFILSKAIYKLWREHADVMDHPGEGQEATDINTKKTWKIDYGSVTIGDLIGQGVTGKTYKAKWRGLIVAMKELVHNSKEDQISKELQHIIRVRHPSLVLFLGICFPSQNKVALMSQYMERGNLSTVLKDKDVELNWGSRITMALEVARAMNYLHCCKPIILHKCLNSINILVNNELSAKVSDYGLDSVRKAAKKTGTMTQPKWIAPEVFKKGKESKESDVYSFGIILWEILTRSAPYHTYGKINAHNNVKFIKDVTNGLRPDIPQQMPAKCTELLNACWNQDPKQRPSFEDVVHSLDMLSDMKISDDEVNNFTILDIKVAKETDGKDWKQEAQNKPWMVKWDEITLDDVIGHGSFGQVYAGQFRGKKVAIKKLTSKTVKNTHFKEFVHELNIMCSLRHPNTVLFIGACLDEGNMCILMEYCEKGNLFEILHDHAQPIDYNRIIKTMTEIAEGVMYLHSNKPPILHRDLKSLNILIDEYWNVKVSDFGLTDFKPDVEGNSHIQLGTPFWLAPEAMENQQFSEASDVYSFGMIIWEMFTRQIPFPNMNPHQAALAVISEDKRPDIPKFVPPNFVTLIESCWQRDPKKRPSFPEVLKALRKLKEEGLPKLELTLNNAHLYRKKTTVYAFKSKDRVIVYKSWGTGESKKGDWVLVGPDDDVYTCDAKIFLKTYSLVDQDHPHMYRKTGKVFAKLMKDAFLIATLEGMEHGNAGDYLAQNPVDGEQWPIASKTFSEMYERSPDQTLPPGAPDLTKGGSYGDHNKSNNNDNDEDNDVDKHVDEKQPLMVSV